MKLSVPIMKRLVSSQEKMQNGTFGVLIEPWGYLKESLKVYF